MPIKAEIVGQMTWDTACVGFFKFRTNGPQEGDAWYDRFLELTFTNLASTRLEVSVNGQKAQPVDSVTMVFHGDYETYHAQECFEFLVGKLKLFDRLLTEKEPKRYEQPEIE